METKEGILDEVVDRLNYFYRRIDGTLVFPNSPDGDILRMVYRAMTLHENPARELLLEKRKDKNEQRA